MTTPTSKAREEILTRVRNALSDKGSHPLRMDHPETGPSGIRPPLSEEEVLARFVERVEDYRAVVVRSSASDVATCIAEALGSSESCVVPTGLEGEWLRGLGVRLIDEAAVEDMREIEGIAAVLTGAAVGIAETGTIVLDHGSGQGRRGLSLLPDLHICVIRADQVVASVQEAVTALRPAVMAGRPLTWISGPSATSDIELERVEGVHGPRTLHVILMA